MSQSLYIKMNEQDLHAIDLALGKLLEFQLGSEQRHHMYGLKLRLERIQADRASVLNDKYLVVDSDNEGGFHLAKVSMRYGGDDTKITVHSEHVHRVIDRKGSYDTWQSDWYKKEYLE